MVLPKLSEVYAHDSFPADRRGAIYERPPSPERERGRERERADREVNGRGREYRLDIPDQRSPRYGEREERDAERHFAASSYQERVNVATVERQ